MTVAPDLLVSKHVQAADRLTLGWALRRAALGLLIMVIGCGGAAWLLYASIEPDRADAAVIASQTGSTAPDPARSR